MLLPIMAPPRMPAPVVIEEPASEADLQFHHIEFGGTHNDEIGDWLKLKFCETASFIVSTVNGKRSVALSLVRGTQLVPAGNVTIPVNHDIPREGAVVEVRYLYAFAESGCVYQPVYLGERDDIEPGECVVAQLKFKPEAEAA